MVEKTVFPKVFENTLSDAQIIAQMNRVRNSLLLINSTQNNCAAFFSDLLDSSNLTRVDAFRTLVFMGDFDLFFGGSYYMKSRGLTNLGAAGHCLGMVIKNDLQCMGQLQYAIAADSANHFEQLMFDN